MFNTEFEPILLKKLTHSNEFFAKAMPILKPKYFTNIGNRELFKIVQNHFQQYNLSPTLTELVASVKGISNAELRDQIINCLQTINKTEEVQNITFMCDETLSWVKDSLYLEALEVGSDGLTKKDDVLKKKAEQILDERAKITIDSDLGLSIDDIDEMIEYYSQRQLGIKTQHKELNKRIGAGFLPKTLSVILAASGVGKSLLMTDLISGMIKMGKNVLLISLEMSDREIMKRVHANAMDLPINSLIDLAKTEGELKEITDRKIINKQDIVDAYNKMKTEGNCGKFYVKDYPAGSFSALQLEALIKSYELEKGIKFDIVFVDYLGICKSDLVSPNVGLYSYIKSIGEEFRASAKRLELPIVSASQLNRCFSPDTVINTEEGEKLAKDVKIGDRIKSNEGYNTVLNITSPEKQKAYKIKTKSGKEIICSGNHKFPTKHGTMTINVGLQKGVKLCTKHLKD